MEKLEYSVVSGASARMKVIRLRTWAITITTLALLVFYIFITLGLNETISWIDFAITAAIQLTSHFSYFYDGERYGETDKLFLSARDDYNERANRVLNAEGVGDQEDLREFCKWDFESRKKEYYTVECGKLNSLSLAEFDVLRQMGKEEIKGLEEWEKPSGEKIHFTKKQRARLAKLIFNPCPVRPNEPSTILSAVDADPTKNIRNGQKGAEKFAHGKRLFMTFGVSIFIGYLAIGTREGSLFSGIVRAAIFIGTLIMSSVSAYIQGERATKEYKKNFYIELTTFLSRFQSWIARTKNQG